MTLTYQPSSSEKKTAILVYLLIGSMMILHKDRISSRTWGHLHQALGRWSLFVIIALISLILVFVPFLSLVPLFILVVIVGIWGWFVYQSWSGEPATSSGGLSVFAQIGKWMTDVMDIHPDVVVDQSHEDTATQKTATIS